jgi:hypothetical protein
MITMVSLFWASTYVLLTIRGAILRDDWSRLLDDNRLLAVSIGAAAYLLVLRKLNEGSRPTLTNAVSWIAGAAVAIMLVRVTVDQLLFDDPQDLEVHLLWSLSWSAYFAIWVMGSIAFEMPPALRRSAEVRPSRVVSSTRAPSAAAATVDTVARPQETTEPEAIEFFIDAIVQQASDFESLDREALAERVLRLGGYDMAGEDDWSRSQSTRARFAAALAAKLAER